MDDDLRASAVRKLRALADRIEAGEDVGGLFYSYDPAAGYTSGMSASVAQADALSAIDDFRDGASDGWDPDMPQLEWGVALPIEVCRVVETKPTPGCEFNEWWDYGLVDPDTYTGPVELHADPSDDDCEEEEVVK